MYGKIENGKLVTSETQLPEYKTLKYAEIPEEFNQETHYITQAEPEEHEDYIVLGVEINELELDDITDIPEEDNEGGGLDAQTKRIPDRCIGLQWRSSGRQ